MGEFKRSVIVTTSSFLLGAALLGLAADWDVLYAADPAPGGFERAEQYYMSWWNASMGVKALLHVMILILAGTISLKVALWSEEALYFDGGSLVFFIAGLAMYGSVMLQSIQSIAPLSDQQPFYVTAFNRPPLVQEPVKGSERIEAIQVLCASNTLLIGALVGIILLQAGDWWVARGLQAHNRSEKIKAKSQ